MIRRALLLLTVVAARAGAQSAADRAMIAAWDDSLRAVTGPAALVRFGTASHAGQGAAADVRQALYDLRRGELDHDRGAEELALIRLDYVANHHHDWPWPDVAMARLFAERSDSEAAVAASAGVRMGENHVEAAWRHLHAAMSMDPEFAPARRLAVELFLPEGDREFRADEEAVLRLLLIRRKPEGDVLLIWGRELRARRRYDSAAAVFGRALAAGTDRARGEMEFARTARALGDTAAARQAYWDGAAHLTPVGREMYRHDLAWILAPDSLKEFDALHTDSVPAWLHRFWDIRDAAAANDPGERLQEHLRRWVFAFAHYRVQMPWNYTMFKRVEYQFEGMAACVNSDSELYDLLAREQPSLPGDIRHREPLLDHRGLIYLRHGEPVRRLFVGQTVQDSIRQVMPAKVPSMIRGPAGLPGAEHHAAVAGPALIHDNEAWVYWVDGALRVFNFRASHAMGVYAPSTLTSYVPLSPVDWFARGSLSKEYAAAADELATYRGALPRTCLETVRAAIKQSRIDADVGTRTDSDTPFIPKPWGALIAEFALGSGADQSGEALVTFAIPTSALALTTDADSQSAYDLSARIVAYDRLTGRTATVDTARHFVASTAGTGYLSGWFEVALDPGDWQIAVRMKQPGDSLGAYALGPHLVIDRGTALTLSDVVIGTASGVRWPAPDNADFPLDVLGAYPVGGTAELYFEVRGLKADDSYHTTIEVRPVDAKSKEIVSVVTSDRATGAMTAVRKALGLERLVAGTYRLTVTVDAGGQRATRTQEIIIVRGP